MSIVSKKHLVECGIDQLLQSLGQRTATRIGSATRDLKTYVIMGLLEELDWVSPVYGVHGKAGWLMTEAGALAANRLRWEEAREQELRTSDENPFSDMDDDECMEDEGSMAA